jgi:hypothetical protein
MSDWMAHVCKNLPRCIDAAAEWDRTGRQPIGRKAEQPPPRSGPTVPDGMPDSPGLRRIRELSQQQRREEETRNAS